MASQSSPSVSYIPVMATPVPRMASSRNALTASLSLPQFSLLPTTRSASQGSPLQASPSSTSSSIKPSASPSPGPGTASGIPKLRAFRNMLPFGPKQAAIANGSPPVSYPPSTSTGMKHRRSFSSMVTSNNHDSPKAGFLTFGPRSSFSMNRRSPAPPSPNRSRSEDHGQSPVISIQTPISVTTTPIENSTPKSVQFTTVLATPEDTSKQSVVQKANGEIESSRLELDISVARSGDLSTIIESELSSMSISKHIPPLEASESAGPQPPSEEEAIDIGGNLILADLAKKVQEQSITIKAEAMDTDSTSAAHLRPSDRSRNLSASWEAGLAEFRRSMSSRLLDEGENLLGSSASASPATAQSPLESSPKGQSSRSSPQQTLDEAEQQGDRQISFDLSSLDPDLAALLSPHNLPPRRKDGVDAAIAAAVDAVTPPPPMSLSPSPSPEPEPEPKMSTKRTSTDTEDYSLAANSKRASGESRRKAHITSLGMQSSPPSRRSRPSSLAMSNSSQSATDLRRSSLDMPGTAKRAEFPNISGAKKESREPLLGRANEETPAENVSSVSKRPLLGRSYSALGNSISAGDPIRRRALTPRLTAPARPSSATGVPKARVASDSRPVLRSSRTSEDRARGYTEDSISPAGRSASALGLSLNTRRLLGGTADRPGSALSRSVHPRTRRRSLSVNEVRTSLARRPTDWINPRTEKAFAAAGLLNHNSDTRERSTALSSTSVTRFETRLRSSARVANNHDIRASSAQTPSLYAPSRHDEPGLSSSASWGRKESASRCMTMAELASGRVDSPVTTVTSSTPTSASNPRTAISSSTATSFSGGSPQQQFQQYQLESALQALKEKHSLEMEALLNALGDSQHTTRALREENSRLRGRISDLEEHLNDLVEQLEMARRSASQQAPNYARSIFGHSRPGSRTGSAEPIPKRQTHSRLQSYIIAPHSTDESEDATDGQITMREPLARTSPGLLSMASGHNARKRSSTASSVFPILPSNMSMLLHEEGDSDNSALHSIYQTQSRAASPTILLSRLTAPSTSNKGKHVSRPSVSSMGSVDLSVLSMPGSPRSLRLNPEHEKHLGDMMSVDFSVIASDE